MKIYRNPFVSYPCYFVKTGAGWSGRAEASKSKGYCVEQHDGKWTCRNGCYYDDTIRNELILVAENRESIHKVIEKAVIDAVLGAGSLITWALCAANTMHEEKLKKVKTNEDMLKLADSEQLRKALKRMCWKTTMYLSPLLREAQEKRIDEWLGEEAGPEWRE